MFFSGFDSRSRRHMWVEFVVGSRPCSECFSPGSIPGLGAVCGLSLLFGLIPAPSVFLRVRFPDSAPYVG